MSKGAFEINDKNELNEIINDENEQNYSFLSKKGESLSDDKDDNEVNTKNRTSTGSPNESCSETSNDFNQQFFNEPNCTFSDEKNIFFGKDITKKKVFPEINYFVCNEQYFKEKIPEGNNYKNSKNYLPKKDFEKKINNTTESDCNKIKIEDIDLNKVNDILKDIEYVQDNINTKKNEENKFDNTDMNFLIDENINLDELSKIPIETFKNIDYSLCSCFNDYNFDFKNNSLLNYNFISEAKPEDYNLEDGQNIDIKPKKKLVTRPGDWYCKYCNNLNFSFRNACNRCRLSKFYSY